MVLETLIKYNVLEKVYEYFETSLKTCQKEALWLVSNLGCEDEHYAKLVANSKMFLVALTML